MSFLDAIIRMAHTQFPNHRQQAFELVDAIHHQRERAHELASLLAHIAVKEPSHRWIEQEQPVIEQLARPRWIHLRELKRSTDQFGFLRSNTRARRIGHGGIMA